MAVRVRTLAVVVLAAAVVLPGCATLRVLQVQQEAERLYKAGRTAEIIPLVENAIADLEPSLGPDHPHVGLGYNGWASSTRTR